MFKTQLRRQISKKTKQFIDLEMKYGSDFVIPIPVVFEKAKGIHVWDVDGKQYIDCLSAYSCVNQGHVHPKIQAALIEQSSKLTISSRAFFSDTLGAYQEKLTSLLGMDRMIPMNSGVEAGETCVKLARRWGYDVKGIPENQAHVLFATQNFWGRSLAACGSSDDPDRFRRFGPFTGMNFDLVEFNSVQALEKKFQENPNIAAYMMEPIQGEAGIYPPSPGYLKGVRALCDKYNVLLIFDEVQTGFGRCGTFMAADFEGVKPDMYALGKSLSGGFLPASAAVTTNEVMDVLHANEHGSTFGGNPLAAKVCEAALDVILDEKLAENSKELGAYFKGELKKFDHHFIKEVRGRGLFIALEVRSEWDKTAKDLCLKFMDEGLLCKPTHNTSIRFTPPLIITKDEIDIILGKIKKVLDLLA